MKYSITEKIAGLLCVFGAIAVLVGFVAVPLCLHWNTGDQNYTGYIYSVTEDFGGLTKAHLRFSEYAGEDNQPAFCIADADKDKARELAGSGKKVKVLVPKGFAFASPWARPMPAQIEIMDGEDER